MICALASATKTQNMLQTNHNGCELTELIACVKRCIYKVQPRTHFFLVLRSKTCSRRRVPTRGVSGVAVVDRCSTSRRSVAAARRYTLRTVFVMPAYLPRILSVLRFETCTRVSIIAYGSHETKISLFCSIQPPIECACKRDKAMDWIHVARAVRARHRARRGEVSHLTVPACTTRGKTHTYKHPRMGQVY